MTLEELSVEYDRFYEEASYLLNKHNPCQFEHGRCSRNRADIETGAFRPEGAAVNDGCCGTTSCGHLASEGCTVKALGCKLHVCEYLDQDNKEFCDRMGELRDEAREMLDSLVTQCFWDKESFMIYLKDEE